MTLLADAPAVPAVRPPSWLRRNRGMVLLAAGLLLAVLLLVLTTGVGTSGSLDPDSYEPSGGRALASLLRDQGVDVQRTGDVPGAINGVPDDATILVTNPSLLSPIEISDLQSVDAPVVLVGATPDTVQQLGIDADVEDLVRMKNREPGCGWRPALEAATVRIGGFQYGGEDPHAQRCYDRTLVQLPDQGLVLLGSPEALSNERLGDEGNAELGLQLLGQGRSVRWLVPDPNRAVEGERPATSFGDLLPSWVHAAENWLVVVVVVAIVWRGRRLGRVVPEPLPVVVRAAETVEGRGRLYRAAGARGSAAEALRSGARDRVGRRLGAGAHPTPEALVELVSRRTSRPSTDVLVLLYGPPPVDDDALLRLARDLDALALEVSGS